MQLVSGQYEFRATDLKTKTLTGAGYETNAFKEADKKLFCVFCKSHISNLDAAMSVHGTHTHTYSNPAGIVYTIHCFQSAPGCRAIGASTDEYTWFNGYQWRIVVCRACSAQLGWLFSNDNQFYGLIANRLTQ